MDNKIDYLIGTFNTLSTNAQVTGTTTITLDEVEYLLKVLYQVSDELGDLAFTLTKI